MGEPFPSSAGLGVPAELSPFKGPPFLLALKNPPGPVQCVLMKPAEGTEPESDVLESLDFPELDGDNTRRTAAAAVSPSGKPDS